MDQELNDSIVKRLLRDFRLENGLADARLKVLLERTHSLLRNVRDGNEYNLALSVICHVANTLPKNTLSRQLLYECIVQSRVYLYNEMIMSRDKNYYDSIFGSFIDSIGQEFYTLDDTDTILTKDQKHLFDSFQSTRKIIVSAPTSFGKSRIIEEIILHNKYKMVGIVLPTIALLNETYLKFKANNALIRKYHLINSIASYQVDRNKDFIFILTPEKMDLLLDEFPEIRIDFFTMDEIYKIQDDLDRKYIFSHCLYRLLKHNPDFYLIGPYFDGFSSNFLSRTGSSFFKYSSEIVQKDSYDLTGMANGQKINVEGKEIKKLKGKDANLRNLIRSLPGQTLVYVGRRDTCETRARKLADLSQKQLTSDLVQYLKENVADDWSLPGCLEKGVAYHHSAIPKYIQIEIVDAFNNGFLDVIVCTSTLTEGVNTSAKNVIIFDNTKGEAELSGFDVKNIKGRAGRFLVHFVGNFYSLESLPAESDKSIIEFSYFDNKNLIAEEAIQVDKSDLTDDNLKRREGIEELLAKENIPLNIIRDNKFILIHRQIALINHLRRQSILRESIFFNSNLPTNAQLHSILTLCHEFLFTDADREDRGISIGNLIRLTNYYIHIKPSLKELINAQSGKKTDTKVRTAFKLMSRYFEFALPRYLTAFERIFNFVQKEESTTANRTINLKYLITKLEFGYTTEHEIALKEAGLPHDIVTKVASLFRDCSDIEQIRIKFMLNATIIERVLNSFEQKIFKRYV